MSLINIGFLLGLSLILLLVLAVYFRLRAGQNAQTALPAQIMLDMETRHRAVLSDLHAGLAQQSDRMQTRLTELQIAQTERLAETRETVTGQFGLFQTAMLEKLADQSRADQNENRRAP